MVRPLMIPKKTAAFFRLEGTLLRHGLLSSAAYIVANEASIKGRMRRLGQVALTAPITQVLNFTDRSMSNRLLNLAFRGMSEDRIAVVAEEYVNDVLKDELSPEGLARLDRAKKDGHRVVLVSEAISFLVAPLRKHLRSVDDELCNQLEFRDGFTTGRLLPPIIGGHETSKAVMDYADHHGIDLRNSLGFAATGQDLLFLASLGSPCAVNPDFSLRQAARQANWPILEFRS